MSDISKQELEESLSNVLDRHRGVDAETHKKHHEFIDECIDEVRRKREFRASIRKTVFGWGIIMVITGIGYAVGDWIQHVLKFK